MAIRKLPSSEPTERQKRDICYWLSRGAIPDTALAKAGVARNEFNLWLRAGAEGIEPFATFAKDVDKALVDFECKLLDFICENSNKNVNAAQYLLNLRFGAKYKKAAETDASLTEPEKTAVVNFSEEALAEAEARVMAGSH